MSHQDHIADADKMVGQVDQQLAAKVYEILAANRRHAFHPIEHPDTCSCIRLSIDEAQAALLQAFSEQERLARIDELSRTKINSGVFQEGIPEIIVDSDPASNDVEKTYWPKEHRLAELKALAQPTKEKHHES